MTEADVEGVVVEGPDPDRVELLPHGQVADLLVEAEGQRTRTGGEEQQVGGRQRQP